MTSQAARAVPPPPPASLAPRAAVSGIAPRSHAELVTLPRPPALPREARPDPSGVQRRGAPEPRAVVTIPPADAFGPPREATASARPARPTAPPTAQLPRAAQPSSGAQPSGAVGVVRPTAAPRKEEAPSARALPLARPTTPRAPPSSPRSERAPVTPSAPLAPPVSRSAVSRIAPPAPVSRSAPPAPVSRSAPPAPVSRSAAPAPEIRSAHPVKRSAPPPPPPPRASTSARPPPPLPMARPSERPASVAFRTTPPPTPTSRPTEPASEPALTLFAEPAAASSEDTLAEHLSQDAFDVLVATPIATRRPAAAQRARTRLTRTRRAAYEVIDEALAHAARYRDARPLLAVGVVATWPILATSMFLALMLGLSMGGSAESTDAGFEKRAIAPRATALPASLAVMPAPAVVAPTAQLPSPSPSFATLASTRPLAPTPSIVAEVERAPRARAQRHARRQVARGRNARGAQRPVRVSR